MPITPAPTITRFCGNCGSDSSSVDVTTAGVAPEPTALVASSSSDSPGGNFDDEPVATMMLSAVYCSPSMATVLASTNCALPLTSVMPGRARIDSTAERSPSMMPCLRWSASCQLAGAPSCANSASWARLLVGMQPQLRHVPPASAASITVTCSPFWAAYCAAR